MAQHVTFFRMNVQPDKMDEFLALMEDSPEETQRLAQAGWERNIGGRSKDDPNTFWGVVTWDTSERYYANADDPEQGKWYQQIRPLLTGDPEWFDCDLVVEQSA